MFCTATLAMVGEFDYEVEPYVNISIQAGDREGLQTSVELTLSVVDRNDQPQVCNERNTQDITDISTLM